MSLSFVNLKGQPITHSAIAEKEREEYRRQYLAMVPVPRKPTAKNGYAHIPGTGPAGETCKTCAHCVSTSNGGRKRFSKCLLRKATWTHGAGTDILQKSPACSKWAQEPAALAADREKQP